MGNLWDSFVGTLNNLGQNVGDFFKNNFNAQALNGINNPATSDMASKMLAINGVNTAKDTATSFAQSPFIEALKGGGALWGAYNQQKMANKNFDLQRQAFEYNKALSDEERKRRGNTEASLGKAFNNSMYGKGM